MIPVARRGEPTGVASPTVRAFLGGLGLREPSDPRKTRWHLIPDPSPAPTLMPLPRLAGSVKTVRRYLQLFRATMTAPPAAPVPPKPRHVTCWIMTKPGNLDPVDHDRLAAITARSPALQSLAEHVHAFAEMMTGRTGEQHLPAWIDRVLTTDSPAGLRSFANGLRRDLAAVTAGLSLPDTRAVRSAGVREVARLPYPRTPPTAPYPRPVPPRHHQATMSPTSRLPSPGKR
jgi:hypothetical protein